MKQLKSIVSKNLEHAKNMQQGVSKNDVYSYRFWEGYILALESVFVVLPDDEAENA